MASVIPAELGALDEQQRLAAIERGWRTYVSTWSHCWPYRRPRCRAAAALDLVHQEPFQLDQRLG